MQRFVFILLALLVAGAAGGDDGESPLASRLWQMPRIWPRHCVLRQQLVDSLQRGDRSAMEATCREALELMPTDPTWRYNLACALAQRYAIGLAMTELEKAVTCGWRDADAIVKDPDFTPLHKQPRFAEIVAKARALKDKPVPGLPQAAPVRATTGGTVTFAATNLVWNFDVGCFEALLDLKPAAQPIAALASRFGASKPVSRATSLVTAWLSEGTAAGNAGDLYVNRDAAHSLVKTSDFPLLTSVKFDAAGTAAGADVDHPNTLFPPGHAVFGNASRGRVAGAYWRSLGRASMTEPGFAARMDMLYRNNQFWIFPSVKDHDPKALGDVFPAAAPFQLISEGMSWSDQPFIRAALAASAVLPPPTKEAVLRRGLMGPTLQWLFRRTQPGVQSEADYLSPRAHPTAFNVTNNLDETALVTAAHALRPEQIPPFVALTVVNSRTFPVRYPHPVKDYPDVLPEILYATPSSVAIILRAPGGVRTFLFQARTDIKPTEDATDAPEFAWRVVHGDATRVKISTPLGETFNTPERGFAQIDVDRRGLTNRIDVACFAKTAGTAYGAPSIISFYPLPLERRVYRADGQIDSIDYTNTEQAYCDPSLALPRRWKDVYVYTPDGKPRGFVRTFGGQTNAAFTVTGERILERDADGRPSQTVPVRYLPRQTTDPLQPFELTYIDATEAATK